MKKSILILSICAVIAACNSKSDKNGTSDSTAAANQSAKAQNSNADTNSTKTGTEPAGTTSSANANGAKLMAAADCMSCHKEQVKLVGPAFKDIASKYKSANDATIDTLANKVIKGGKGNWGEVPMTPHPTIALADAKEMVKYILTIK